MKNGEATSQSTYIPLSRGIGPYLGVFSPYAIVVYIQLALRARWQPGPDHGTLEISLGANRRLEEIEQEHPIGVFPRLAERLGMDRKTTRATLQELALGHKIGILTRNKKTAPPFIEILETRGRTKGKTLVIRILKAKLSARQFKPAPEQPRTHARTQAGARPHEDDTQEGPGTSGEAMLQEMVDQVVSSCDTSELFGEQIPK